MSLRTVLLIAVSAIALLSACNKSEIEDTGIDDFGYDYFPLEVGRSWEYEVDSIIYDPAIGGTAVDSFRTYVREYVADTLPDNTGAVLYRVERYYRRSDTLPWQPEKVLTLARDGQRAFRVEDNLRFTKMAFPVKEGKYWDGNAFFDDTRAIFVAGESVQMFKGWQYRILETGASATVGGAGFDDVVTVQNADNRYLNDISTVLELRVAIERYARGVGLIYRELDILDTVCEVCCDFDTGEACRVLPWEEKAEKGFSLRQRLIRYY